MQNAAETVYEFGSSPDKDDDNNDNSQPSSLTNKIKVQQQSSSSSSQSVTTPTGANVAGTNLRSSRTTSTNVNQKLKTSFISLSDNQPSSHSPNPKISNNPSSTSSSHQHLSDGGQINTDDISSSDDQLLLKDNKKLISNASNTSLSTTTTSSSRGNISQSGMSNTGTNLIQSSLTGLSQRGLSGQAASSVTFSSSQQQNNPNFDSNVISERVKNLATQIYQELKRIISRCNYDEDILSGLMPLIVRVLESLDLALIENQQLQVELELCKDDNEQLVIMFEKEKAAKRAIDKRLIESEYAYEEERQQYQQKIESLDSTVKMFELKAKNTSDQATRFEEKEAERKKEYNKLHDRYTELLKSHCDVVERFRHLIGNSEVANLGNINVPQAMVASSSDITIGDSIQAQQITKMKLRTDDLMDTSSSYRTTRDTLKSWNAETELTLEDASLVVIDDMLESNNKLATVAEGSSQSESDKTTTTSNTTTTNTDQEHEKESENDSIAYTSMEKEFRKLIQENKDLLNTKNALNVVKDDLIAEVDRLTNEVTMYEQAVEQLNSTKDQMKQKVFALDAELRKTKEELDKAKQKIRENNEEGVPYSQRKRFGRAEMAKVLMERNNYKERFMELQDAVRYTELVRANKVETEKRSGLWKFFSNLFGAPPLAAIGHSGGQTSSRNSSPVVTYHGSTGSSITAATDQHGQTVFATNQLATLTSGNSDALNSSLIKASNVVGTSNSATIRTTSQRLSSNSDLIVLMDSDLNIDRANFSSALGGSNRLNNSELMMSGYIHAYGWSLPASAVHKNLLGTHTGSDSSSAIVALQNPLHSLAESPDNSIIHQPIGSPTSLAGSGAIRQSTCKLGGLQVPIPQYCRPLTGDSLGMKIWCATAIDSSGGYVIAPKEEPGEDKQQTPDDQYQASFGGANSSGSIVNISTSTPIKSPTQSTSAHQNSLRMLEKEVNQALNGSIYDGPERANQLPTLKTTTEMVLSSSPVADDLEELSSCVWICSTQHSRSKITIIDIETKPNELLDSFYVPTFLYCIKSIPGSKFSDLPGIMSLKQLEVGNDSAAAIDDGTDFARGFGTLNMLEELISTQRGEFYKLVKVDLEAEDKLRRSRLEAAALRKKKKQVVIDEKLNQTFGSCSYEQQKADVEDPQKTEADRDGNSASLGGRADSSLLSEKSSTIMSEDDAEISRILDNNVSDGMVTLQKLHDFVAHTQQPEIFDNQSSVEQRFVNDSDQPAELSAPENQPGASGAASDYKNVVYYQPISTSLSTVWLGGKDSILYVHSAIGQWKDCVACVKLSDSILQICHFKGRVFVALADGSLCVFFRNFHSKQWEFSQYLLIDINLMAEVTSDAVDLSESTASASTRAAPSATGERANFPVPGSSGGQPGSLMDETKDLLLGNSPEVTPTKPLNVSQNQASRRGKGVSKVAGIRCLEIANKNLLVGYRNRVLIIDPITLKLKHSFNVVPQVDNQIRQIVSMKDGVFICMRSDLILRLYSSIRPYQHIQNIDIEPIVTRLISPKTFVISHITAMKVADDNTLWIGNAHGIILTIPCKLVPQVSETSMVDLNGEPMREVPSGLSIARYVPKCDITNAQISFHGHKDAVKFFIQTHKLMLSGGQGYLDFRLDMDDQSKSISDKSHLILWQLPH